MGKIMDAIGGIIMLVLFLYLANRIGLTAGDVWTYAKHFFSGIPINWP